MSIRQLFLFLCGQLGIMSLVRYFFQWILAYSSTTDSSTQNTVLFSASALGGLLLCMRIFDAISDPIIGTFSDRYHSTGKSRKTLLLYATIIPVIGTILCFTPTHTMPMWGKWTLEIVGMLIFFVGYTCYAIPYWSLVDELATTDQHLRSTLSNLLGLGTIIATILVFTITPFLVEHYGYLSTAVALGAAAGLLMVVPTKLDINDESQHNSSQSSESQQIATLLKCMSNKQFLAYTLLFSGVQLSLTIVTAVAPFLVTLILKGTISDVAYLMGALLLPSIPTFLIVPNLCTRYGLHKVLIASSILLSISFSLTVFLGQNLLYSPLVTAIVLFGLTGPCIAVMLGTETDAIVASSYTQENTRVSSYIGMFNLIIKGGNGLALFICGLGIEWAQSSKTSTPIQLLLGSCAILCILGLMSYLYFTKDKKAEG